MTDSLVLDRHGGRLEHRDDQVPKVSLAFSAATKRGFEWVGRSSFLGWLLLRCGFGQRQRLPSQPEQLVARAKLLSVGTLGSQRGDLCSEQKMDSNERSNL